ncbi:SSrecog-domain-containing protein [Saccharata proteae CBS 121410]|uniref:FACT complex subunit POB3 n=1 Tax=Saccharata proteae CBS 121410 TaxID=1314787 RepID=A0A9P4LW95_9PEZI|nr:SSrecog-domain-containing protein [Saccharata proteae CBS 121410]
MLPRGDAIKESFEGIHLDLSKQPGRCRFAESGLGWKPSAGGDTFTLDSHNIVQAQWSRAARGYELKVLDKTSRIIQLDGFPQEEFERLSKLFKMWYSINLESREHALRGYNWGKAEFGKAELAFNVQSRPAFELPYSEIANTNLAGKNEVAVEFSLPANGEDSGTNGALGGARGRGRKAGGGRDQLVEMRFYIPGTVTKREKKEEGEEVSDGDEEEEHNAASLFYNTLIEKAEIGEIAGDTYITFEDILHLTPRGRFGLDMYETSFRLRGKTYDYKIQYDQIKKFFVLPKPDDMHQLITIGVDPPLRQGQTRYPFIVMQFKRDEELDEPVSLNMSQEVLETKYKDKLEAQYSGPIYRVIAQLLRGLSGKKTIAPSREFSSHHAQSGIKCSIKANEGHMYCMDKSFLFVPKPATYIAFDQISVITMSRVGGAMAASRTFDITITMKNGAEHQFSNINREEQAPLEEFFKGKNLKTKNEMADDSGALLAAALQEGDLDDDEDDVPAERGSADEDSEELDEDFQADSESDVAEEYDSNHESSGDSDEEMADADGDGDKDGDSSMVERPKKKAKTEE